MMNHKPSMLLLLVGAGIRSIARAQDPYVAPQVERTTGRIELVEERTETMPWGTHDLQFYRNQAYDCGLTGKYTFLVVNPVMSRGAIAEAPLWVYLHGGANGYFDADGTYIAKAPNQDQDTHNHEETFDRMWSGDTNAFNGKPQAGTVYHRTIDKRTGAAIDSTLTRRLEEGYRLLVVSMCDHDGYSGLGTPYPNNPNGDGAQVNGLQATMAAIDYVQSNYATTHTFAHGTSAGSQGVWSLASSYGSEGKGALQGIVADSAVVTPNFELVFNKTTNTVENYDAYQASDKIGHYLNIEIPSYPEAQIGANDFRSVPALFLVGDDDPLFGGDLPAVPEAAEEGLSNPEFVVEFLGAAIANQRNSPHELHVLPNTGHVPTNSEGRCGTINANDLVDAFLLKTLGPESQQASLRTCSSKLVDLCPPQPQACLQCAVRDHAEALLRAGCDAQSVSRLCASGASSEATPKPSTCSDKVLEMCPTTSRAACLQCVKDNRAEMVSFGCTEESVRNICSNGASDDGDSSDRCRPQRPNQPGPAETCVAAFESVCPSESSLNGQNCARCAQTNKEGLLAAGCTIGIVTRICKGETQAEDDDSVFDPGRFKVPVPETVLPTGATDAAPLRVFVLAGQSGAQGQASVQGLELEQYADLRGPQENVWFSSIQSGKGAPVERFYMGPMIPGDASDTGLKFGPEVAIGKRLMDARGGPGSAPVLIIKYAWGGSNLEKEWNPTAEANFWDREADDGTAAWLLDNGVTVMSSKKHLYSNMMYTIRKSLETLDEGNIPYELEGMFWLQGSADKGRTWQEYGQDTITFFEQIRADLDAPALPIVDQGGGTHHNIQTAKQYAASVIEGCNHVVARMGMGVADPDSDCVSGAGKACEDGFRNYDLFDFYGYDPVMTQPEYAGFLKPGTTIEKEFAWFKSFPTNNHMDYDGKILQGRMMANMFIQSFTEDELADEWLAEDVQTLFPMDACDPSVNDGKPSEDNVCWMDLREEADFAEATCMMNGLELFDSMGEMAIMKLTSSAGSRIGSTAVLALASTAILWLLV